MRFRNQREFMKWQIRDEFGDARKHQPRQIKSSKSIDFAFFVASASCRCLLRISQTKSHALSVCVLEIKTENLIIHLSAKMNSPCVADASVSMPLISVRCKSFTACLLCMLRVRFFYLVFACQWLKPNMKKANIIRFSILFAFVWASPLGRRRARIFFSSSSFGSKFISPKTLNGFN